MRYSAYKEEDISSLDTKIFYFVSNIDKCDRREALLDWFTVHDRKTLTDIPQDIKNSDIIVVEGDPIELEILSDEVAVHIPNSNIFNLPLLSVTKPSKDIRVYGTYKVPNNNSIVLLFKIAEDSTLPAFRMHEQFMLSEGMIANYKGDAIKTDIGKFFVNALVFAKPLGDLIPYWNCTFDLGKFNKTISDLILEGKMNRKQYEEVINNLYWFSNDGSIFIQTFGEKCIGTDPKIIKRRDELFKQYEGQLDDPVVMDKIDKELVKMDIEYLKGDPGAVYYDSQGSKGYSGIRKKLWINFGTTTTFGDEQNKYMHIPHSLSEGFDQYSIHKMNNVLRGGSYSRSMETAKGGDQTKFVLRAFQNITIDDEDCKSKRGLKVELTDKNKKMYVGRWLVDGELLTKENIDKYVGKEIEIRSPLYCKSKPGFCYKCCGELFRKLQMKAVGLNELLVSSTFLYSAMKAFHNTSVNSVTVTDIHRFLR